MLDRARSAFLPSLSAGASQQWRFQEDRTGRSTSNSGTLTIIDGATNATSTVAIPAGTISLGTNPVTNEIYTGGAAGVVGADADRGVAATADAGRAGTNR